MLIKTPARLIGNSTLVPCDRYRSHNSALRATADKGIMAVRGGEEMAKTYTDRDARTPQTFSGIAYEPPRSEPETSSLPAKEMSQAS